MKLTEIELNLFIEKLTNEHSELSSVLLNAKTDSKLASKKMLKITKIVNELIALKELLIDKPVDKNY